jgi:hypothetical protein
MNFPNRAKVVRYSYLWHREYKAGFEEGTKDRPCAVVLSATDIHSRRRVMVLPITHSPPGSSGDAIEIPAATKARLGLDSEQSWIVISAINRFTWPGPDVRPIPGRDVSTIAYGMLPPSFFARVRDAFLARCTGNRVRIVRRSE